MKIKTDKNTRVKAPKGNKNLAVLLSIILVTVVLCVSIFYVLSAVFKTEKYYVLNRNIAAHTTVTGDMLQEVEVSKDGAPKNAITKNEVVNGQVISKIALNAGDILTTSNTGLTLNTENIIPDSWVVTSFNVNSNNAIGGLIRQGDYFDIIGIDDVGTAKYIFTDVLALQVNDSTPVTETNKNGEVVKLDETLQYIVGMTPEDAGLLHSAIAKYKQVILVKAPYSIKYDPRDIETISNAISWTNDSPTTDIKEGTDPTAKEVLRDKKGRPINQENCNHGKVSEKICTKNGIEIDQNELKRYKEEEAKKQAEKEANKNQQPQPQPQTENTNK